MVACCICGMLDTTAECRFCRSEARGRQVEIEDDDEWFRRVAALFQRDQPPPVESGQVRARRAVERYGSRKRAADELGVSERQLRRWLDERSAICR